MNQRSSDAPETGRDDESRTITLSGSDLRNAIRLLSYLIGATDNSSLVAVRQTTPANVHRQLLVERARQVLRERRQRSDLFGSMMFGEPGWDILLILYTEEDECRPTVSRLATAAGTPMSTGLRWLDYLESEHWICRRPHPTDGRVDFVELRDKARNTLDSYFSETLTMG